MTNKVDAANNVIFRYSYDANGRLMSRWTPGTGGAGITTSYSYDGMGNLRTIDYPGSQDITLQYDALNRMTNMSDGLGTTSYAYDSLGSLLSENGPWTDDTVTYTYANRLRTGLSLSQPNASAWTQSYSYDALKRMSGLTSPAGSFGYQYPKMDTSLFTYTSHEVHDPESALVFAGGLVGKITLPNGSCVTNTVAGLAVPWS